MASLYYVDVIDEYVPRLDAEMLAQFRSFVEAEAQAHGTVLSKQVCFTKHSATSREV